MTNKKNRTTIVLAARISTLRSPQTHDAENPDRQSDRIENLLHTCVSAHGGHELDFDGDTFHTEFRSAVNAIDCAAAIMARLQAKDSVAIGIGVGDRYSDGDTLRGGAVEMANSLCAMARANEVVVTAAVRERAQRRQA